MQGENLTQHWVLNLAENPAIRIFMDDKIWTGTAQVRRITGLDDPLLPVFTRKYGRVIVGKWYKGQHNYVEVSLAHVESGSIPNDELIYGDLEAAFDGVADNYDHHIFGNVINSWLRTVSIGLLKTIFKPGDTLLEIGCGTGTETLALAQAGMKIVACDISPRMIEVLKRKVSAAGLSQAVHPVYAKPSMNLSNVIMSEIGRIYFDGAYSTYGAVNTEPNLGGMFREIHSILKDDARLVLGVWNKYCLYEMAGYSLRLKPSLAFARLRNPVPVGKSRFCVTSNAFSIRSLNQYIKPYFKIKKVFGVVITLPPSNLTKYAPNGRALKLLEKFDLRLGSVFPINRLGDHFLGVYEKL